MITGFKWPERDQPYSAGSARSFAWLPAPKFRCPFSAAPASNLPIVAEEQPGRRLDALADIVDPAKNVVAALELSA